MLQEQRRPFLWVRLDRMTRVKYNCALRDERQNKNYSYSMTSGKYKDNI